MTEPVCNLDDLEMGPDGYAVVCERVGAKKLGYNVSICAPGATTTPFHNHHINEEMFLILEGEGVLRFGDRELPLRKHDLIACPPGGRDVAHCIRNTGDAPLKYLALSTKEPYDICEYPDTNQVGVMVGDYGNMTLRGWFDAGQTQPPPWMAKSEGG